MKLSKSKKMPDSNVGNQFGDFNVVFTHFFTLPKITL